jgi:sugar/nucleoside kinase (ribokinase family)
MLKVAADPVEEVVDPTGAGDAFDGVLLAHLARGATLQDALKHACSAGAAAASSAESWPPER